MARILYEILSGVVLNLIYMSMYSDGLKLTPLTYNPIVGEPFDLVCNTEVNISQTVAITSPDDKLAGSCTPALSPFPAGCANTDNYNTSWDEEAHTVTVKTSSLESSYSGTWKCSHNLVTGKYNLVNREIKDESFALFPPSFTDNITSESTPISLSATYGCTDFEIFFLWFVVDSASNKIDIKGPNNTVENASVCTSLSGFSGYTEIKEVNEDVYSSSYVTKLDGSYRIGVEVHYTDEVTTLHSIKYFDTYFVFNPPTTAPTTASTTAPTTAAPTTDATTPWKTNDSLKDNLKEIIIGAVLGISGLIIIITIIVCVMRGKTNRDNDTNPKHDTTDNRRDQTGNHSCNPEHVHTQNQYHIDYDKSYISANPEHEPIPNEHHVDHDRRYNFANPEHVSMPNGHHVDYYRKYNSDNIEHVPMPNEPPVDYVRRNDHNSQF